MDLTASIAAASVNAKEAKLQQDVHIALLAKVMDAEAQAAAQLISQLEGTNPILGNQVDVYA